MFISSPKTVRLKTQKELIFQVKSKGKKRIGGFGDKFSVTLRRINLLSSQAFN